ncbi:hypothetical protein P0F65_03890 [Sphingomonas sp. I4]
MTDRQKARRIACAVALATVAVAAQAQNGRPPEKRLAQTGRSWA